MKFFRDNRPLDIQVRSDMWTHCLNYFLFWSKQNTEHVAVVHCKLQFAVIAAIIV
jgi:hypothetical protein